MIDARQAYLSIAVKDSNRFNRRIARGRIDGNAPPPGALAAEIADLRADTAIIRVRAGMDAPIQDLINHGFMPIHADTLVYHARQLDISITGRPPPSGLTVAHADGADGARISTIASDAFRSYRSHYHANPLLDPVAITEGYVEWAVAFLNAQATDHETWIVRQDGDIIGFATCALSENDKSAEIVLNAVDPVHGGRGVYGYLLHQMLLSYQARGFALVRISTQVWNYTVQRAWARAGFLISHAYDTYHINVPAGGS